MHQIAPFKDCRGACLRTPLASAWLRDMQISKSEKNHSCPPPPAKSWLRPWPIPTFRINQYSCRGYVITG